MAQRPATANELVSQFEKARRVVEAFGIPVYDKAGFEADDVIGTISTVVKEDVVIVTGDRDQLQLVNSRVKVYMPILGLANAKLMGEEEVRQKMGVPPNLIDDYKALVGDPSDNYPGVPGIGPKTAVSLLDKYGTLDNIYKNLKEIPAATAEKLTKGRKYSEISKKLATIVRDVPIGFKIEEAAKWDVDSQKVLDLFAEFGFKTLTERVKKVGKELDKEKQLNLI